MSDCSGKVFVHLAAECSKTGGLHNSSTHLQHGNLSSLICPVLWGLIWYSSCKSHGSFDNPSEAGPKPMNYMAVGPLRTSHICIFAWKNPASTSSMRRIKVLTLTRRIWPVGVAIPKTGGKGKWLVHLPYS